MTRGRLTPEAIHKVHFRRSPSLLGGLSPDDVETFVDQVAADMASLYRELATVYAENHRIKTALHDWQSRYASNFTTDARPPQS
jgi:DivIVA domain-containing protein